ncbi:hypothetical protein Dsin_028065 [Dipteronia sinensis]|uniref:Transposase n=1 Tax=Dipteronia sinensis TaxID=43782 RepID=A0AAD9ZQF6_9ROSI|nr:hypothetical protein Dsin_028065 [Dipteronia sinensis]
MKGNPFKKMVGGEITFHLGQTFGNAVQMREIFREYAIQKGVVLKRVKNDNVYNNKETKVKWIASKFENLVKTNQTVSVKVICDLLRENYRVSVDFQRLYNSKKRTLAGLAKDHAKCFGLLRKYAYMVNQSNPGSAVHICTQEPQPTFQRMFLSFEAQKLGFLEGCRLFIGVDECHLKIPFGGVLLSAVT